MHNMLRFAKCVQFAKGECFSFLLQTKIKYVQPNWNCYHCELWTEAHSGSSGNVIASALVKILNELVKEYPGIITLILWSDSCVPQNKNRNNTIAIKVFLMI